jgi:hypothetical protein
MTGSSPFPAEFGPGPFDGGPGTSHVPASPDLVADAVISPPLRERMALGGGPIGIVIELKLRYPGGVPAAADRVLGLLGDRPAEVNGSYVTTALTADGIRALVGADREDAPTGMATTEPVRADRGAIYRVWPNFGITALITRSIITTKCQAVHRSFNATGAGIVWAVLDSGIQKDHPHFAMHGNLEDLPHKSFVGGDPTTDPAGHGTHVAGILAGQQVPPGDQKLKGAVWYQDDSGIVQPRVTEFP